MCFWELLSISTQDAPRVLYCAQEVRGMIYKVLGEKLREARKRAGMTLEKLAEASGLSVTHVGAVERGAKTPSLAALYSICAALGVRMADVLAGE